MKSLFILLAGLILLYGVPGVPAAEIPEEILKIVPLYPNAKVRSCDVSKSLTQVKFDTDATPKEVYDYYKKEMSGRGWTIVFDKVKPDETRLVMTKEDRQFGFGAYHMPRHPNTVFFFSIKDRVKKKTPEPTDRKSL